MYAYNRPRVGVVYDLASGKYAVSIVTDTSLTGFLVMTTLGGSVGAYVSGGSYVPLYMNSISVANGNFVLSWISKVSSNVFPAVTWMTCSGTGISGVNYQITNLTYGMVQGGFILWVAASGNYAYWFASGGTWTCFKLPTLNSGSLSAFYTVNGTDGGKLRYYNNTYMFVTSMGSSGSCGSLIVYSTDGGANWGVVAVDSNNYNPPSHSINYYVWYFDIWYENSMYYMLGRYYSGSGNQLYYLESSPTLAGFGSSSASTPKQATTIPASAYCCVEDAASKKIIFTTGGQGLVFPSYQLPSVTLTSSYAWCKVKEGS